MKQESFTGSSIILKNIQIKSLKKARKLARQLDRIEKNCGIQSVGFTLENSFICCDIDIERLNKTPMEKTLRELIAEYRKK